MTISRERLIEHFDYLPETGEIFWKKSRPKGSAKAGDHAGTITTPRSGCRYRTLTLCKKKIRAHRAAWIITYGEIPPGKFIDHIDGDGLNNRLVNLRLVTHEQNQRNSRTPDNNQSGHMNIRTHANGRYMVQVANKHIGMYATLEEAVDAREMAYLSMGFHENHGRKAS